MIESKNVRSEEVGGVITVTVFEGTSERTLQPSWPTGSLSWNPESESGGVIVIVLLELS
jgi:hypothetical protein